jgi:hypothetical protein
MIWHKPFIYSSFTLFTLPINRFDFQHFYLFIKSLKMKISFILSLFPLARALPAPSFLGNVLAKMNPFSRDHPVVFVDADEESWDGNMLDDDEESEDGNVLDYDDEESEDRSVLNDDDEESEDRSVLNDEEESDEFCDYWDSSGLDEDEIWEKKAAFRADMKLFVRAFAAANETGGEDAKKASFAMNWKSQETEEKKCGSCSYKSSSNCSSSINGDALNLEAISFLILSKLHLPMVEIWKVTFGNKTVRSSGDGIHGDQGIQMLLDFVAQELVDPCRKLFFLQEGSSRNFDNKNTGTNPTERFYRINPRYSPSSSEFEFDYFSLAGTMMRLASAHEGTLFPLKLDPAAYGVSTMIDEAVDVDTDRISSLVYLGSEHGDSTDEDSVSLALRKIEKARIGEYEGREILCGIF